MGVKMKRDIKEEIKTYDEFFIMSAPVFPHLTFD
jgi:hypothetical protein